MPYTQITLGERYSLMALHSQGMRPAAIARVLGRHRSSIKRELERNRAKADGYYRPQLADWYARGAPIPIAPEHAVHAASVALRALPPEGRLEPGADLRLVTSVRHPLDQP